MAKVANLKSNIQSTIQQSINEKQKQIASSSAAAKAGSTETPTVTATPKVTQTAKAVPSLKPEITPVSISTTPTPTVNAKDLLGSKTTPTLRKAAPDLLSKSVEKKDVASNVIPGNIIASADSIGGSAKETVDKTLMQQFSDWFKETPQKVTQKVGSLFKEPVLSLGTSFERMINDTEYWVAGLADVIETSLGGEGGFAKAFQEQQGWYWDEYGREIDIEGERLYQEDKKSQDIADRVSDWVWIRTGDRDISDMIGSVAGHVTATLKDPKQIASTVGYMAPALILQAATGGGFLANTAIWLPSQSTNVYKDFSQDSELTSKYTDNQLFGISTGLGTLLSMVETFGDALGDMPWAKAMSRDIRNAFTKSLRKEVTKGLSKEITDVVDKNLIKDIKKPILNALRKWYAGSFGEGVEEVVQDTLQTEGARALGSKREGTSLEQMLTTFFVAQGMGLIIQTPGAAMNIKQNSDLRKQYEGFSKAVDELAPGINEETKQAFFSAMITSQQNDANLSDRKIEKYEAQTTQLYNQISELEQQLETTTDENTRTSIKDRISSLNNQIKEIDSKINQWNNTREEINQYLEEYNQDRELEEKIMAQEQTQSLKEEGGENLSEQTMRDEESVSLPSTPEQYQSFYRAITQPQNTFLKDKSYEELATMKADLWAKREDAVSNADYKSGDYLRSIIRLINKEMAEKKGEYQAGEIKKLTFKNAKDYVKKMIDIDKRNGVWSKKIDRDLREGYMQDFLRTNLEGDLAAHLPGLKGVNLKQIEGGLTDAKLRDIAEMLSLVSTTFGVDFNKVISDAELSVNIADDIKNFLYNTDALGQMSWKANKEQIKNLIERTGRQINSVAGDIIKTGVTVTLNRGPERAGSIMSHELWHLIDFALSTEAGLPLKIDSKNRMTYTSIIEGDMDWKTFKVGTYNPTYYNDWSEILARYAEEYFAYKNSPDVFKELSNRPWYWSEEEFQKLLPKFESFIKDRVGAKLLDEQNQFYNQVVRKINENLFQTTLMEFSEREDMEKSEVEYKLSQLESEYAWIMQTIEGMKGDLKDEMEAYVQLSNLQSNYEMAKAKGEEYLNMLKTTPEQQDTTDAITTEVVPEPPQNPETINNGLPQLGGSNIENGLGKIIQGESGNEDFMKSYMTETDRVKMNNRKKRLVGFFKELHQTRKDILTPAISRIYNISPRVAGRLITMETQKDINIHRYRKQAEGFVKTLGGLKGNQALEVKAALLNYGVLASEQGEDIEQYKKEEVAKLKEVLLRNGFKEKDINDMFGVLNDIGQQYKDAGLSIVLTDMYFPRVVKDYEGLIDYMNRVSDKDIKLNKTSLMIRIREIQADDKLNDAEKEARIRRAISMEFNQPGTTSQHGKERKMGKLSDWGPGIYAYYESPIESIDHYITTMVNAIERQLFLGGIKEDANLDADIINQDTEESVSQIIGKLVENGQVSEDDVEELQKSIMAVLNKKPSPKSVTAIKDVTYIATITNFLSAINQLDDLGMVILKDKSGLKHIVKTIFGKANIKYDDLGLEDAYEMFREEGGVTNWLFKKSLFNTFDRLGKTSFINTAWESMIHQSKNPKTRQYLYARLQAMYGTESANRMMEKIDSGNYNDETGQIDIEILRDLLYQLGSTQPLYTSAMPTTYLNHPWARLAYALSSFTLKRIDWLVQGTKEVYQRNGGGAKGATAAGAWVMSVSMFLAMFGAAIGDAGDLLKGEKEDTFLWKWINEGIDEALKSGGSDALDSWLKIWDLSEYDMKTYKQQGLWGVFASKIKPFIFDLGKDVQQAIAKHDMDEITDLAKYVPIFGKLVYYWLWDDLESSTKSEKKSGWDWGDEKKWDWGDNKEFDWGEQKEFER